MKIKPDWDSVAAGGVVPRGSIRTPYNRRERTERRVLVGGHWRPVDAAAAGVLAWLRDGGKAVAS